MLTKIKTCEKCKKVASPARTLTVDGVRSIYCDKCYNSVTKNLKVEKAKVARFKKKVLKSVSTSKLLEDMQLLVRLLGGDTCVTCGTTFDKGKHMAHGGHFKSRRKLSTAFLISNISPQCSHCNAPFGHSGNEYRHGMYLNLYWGNQMADRMDRMSQIVYKFTKDILIDLRVNIDLWLEEARTLQSTSEKEALKDRIRTWQEDQYWYKEILKQAGL